MKKLLYIFTLLVILSSCSTYRRSVSYYTIEHAPGYERDNAAIKNPSISLIMEVDVDSDIILTIINHTDSTMTIDKTQSFFNNSTIYDPEIRVRSSTTYSSKGSSFNIGALTGALGLRGPLQGLLSGVGVGKSNGLSNTTTTYDADMPIVHIAPHGRLTFNRKFDWSGNMFTFCIAYSINRGRTYRNFNTGYTIANYMSYTAPQKMHWTYMNEALRMLLSAKPDLMLEDNFLLRIDGARSSSHQISKNVLYDCQ